VLYHGAVVSLVPVIYKCKLWSSELGMRVSVATLVMRLAITVDPDNSK
jgi:hypothetical protein